MAKSAKPRTRETTRIYRRWGIHETQTVRYNYTTGLYEIREGDRVINIHEEEELEDLMLQLMLLRKRVNEGG